MTAPRTTTPTASRSPAVVWGALAIVYVVWGSTYLAIRVTVEDMPPLLTGGVRFVVASAVVALAIAGRQGLSALRIPLVQIRGTAIVGVLLVAGGNGGVMLGEQSVPSGVAALLVATVPLWVVLLRRSSGDRPRALTWTGVLLGFVGLVVLVLPGGSGGGDAGGIALVVGASACWSVGSFASQRMQMPTNPFVATAWEMLFGGLAQIVVGFAIGERPASVGTYSTDSLLAFAYLIVFGSLVAFTAYVWLLQNAALSLVATYAYVNPVIAVLLGALILDEAITAPILAGGAIVVLGVALVVSAERPAAARPSESESEPPAQVPARPSRAG